MKERGELAYEAFCRSRLDIEPAHLTWGSLTNDTAVEYAAIERAVRNAALEEAAAVCDQWTGAKHTAHDMKTGVFPKQSYAPEALAAAIRAMKEPT